MPECARSFAPQHYQTSVRLMPDRVRASSLARPYIPGVEIRPFRHWENGICYRLLIRYVGAHKTRRWKKKKDAELRERERESSMVGNTRKACASRETPVAARASDEPSRTHFAMRTMSAALACTCRRLHLCRGCAHDTFSHPAVFCGRLR